MKTQLLVSLAALVGASTLEPGCGHNATGAAPPPPTGEVKLTPQQVKEAQLETELIEERDVGGVIRASGRVTFDDLRVAHVFSPVTGRISKILAQPGQRVKKGQPLCVIQSPDLGSAVSDMSKAQAALIQAEKDWKRQKELYESHAAAQRDYEAAESAFLNAKAEMERAQRKARLLRGNGGDGVTQEFMLPAPIEGEIIMRGANPGLELQGQYTGGSALELFTIGELDRVWIIADVFEMDLPRVKQGAPVTVKMIAYPKKTFSGTVEWISGALDATSRTAKVRCSIPNPKGELRPEMYGTAMITVDSARRLAVKRSALLFETDPQKPVVFVQVGQSSDGGLMLKRSYVTVEELEGGDYVPIISGLERGQKVVTAGALLLLGML